MDSSTFSISGISIPAFLFANNTAAVLNRWVDSLTDDTFKGIHHLAPFDYAILVPYFAVLIVLSLYGLHRYHMIRGYVKYRARGESSRRKGSTNCRGYTFSCRSITSSTWWSGCSRKRARSIIRASC